MLLSRKDLYYLVHNIALWNELFVDIVKLLVKHVS